MENRDISRPLSPSGSQLTSEPKHCWICYNDGDHETNRIWISPCRCRGSTRWVHEDCIKDWVNEKMMQYFSYQAYCPLCFTQYIIEYDEVNYFVQALNIFDKLADELYPYLTTGILFLTAYWSAAVYGGITFLQVIGDKKAVTIMESIDPFILFLILPSIPFSLVLGKTIDWEETLLLFVQRFTSKLPLLRTIVPSFLYEPVNSSSSIVQFNSNIIKTTTICAALSLPTAATIVGRLFFDNSSFSPLQKTLLGGLMYIVVKGAFRIYQRQHNVMNKKTRKVIDYPRTNTEQNN